MIDENNPLGGSLEYYEIENERILVEEYTRLGRLDKETSKRLKVENKIKRTSRGLRN